MRSYIWNIAGNGFAMMINFIFGILLARLISPEHYGVFILLILPFNIFHSLAIFTFRAYIFQQEKDSKLLINTKSYYFFYSLLFTFLYLSLGYFLLQKFNMGELFWSAILVLAPSQLLISSFSIDQIYYEVENKFDSINKNRVVATIISNLTAYYLAYKGQFLLALLSRFITYYLVLSLIYNFKKLRIAFSPFQRNLAHFNTYLKTIGTLESFHILVSHIDDLLIGVFLGEKSLGLYSKSYNIFIAPTQNITDRIYETALPKLSKSHPQEAFNSIVHIHSILQHLMVPFLLFFWLNCQEIIEIVLGEKWLSTVPLLKWFVLATILQQSSFIKSLLVAQKKNTELRNYSIVTQLILLVGILLGIQFGIEQIAMNYFICSVIVFLYLLYSLKLGLKKGLQLSLNFVLIPLIIGGLSNFSQFFIELEIPTVELLTKFTITGLSLVFIHMIFPSFIKHKIMALINRKT